MAKKALPKLKIAKPKKSKVKTFKMGKKPKFAKFSLPKVKGKK